MPHAKVQQDFVYKQRQHQVLKAAVTREADPGHQGFSRITKASSRSSMYETANRSQCGDSLD